MLTPITTVPWTPVREDGETFLPDPKTAVLVTYYLIDVAFQHQPRVGTAYVDQDGTWSVTGLRNLSFEVTHWCPLPSPAL